MAKLHRSLKDCLDEIEASQMAPIAPLFSPIRRDLAHISTDRLEALSKRYELRLKVTPNDPKLQMRWQFVMQELGTRTIVSDIEKDLSEGEQ